MTSDRPVDDLHTFEALRPRLIALAYRMLGDVGRAQDMVQDAWLRWHGRGELVVESPQAFLVTVVTRLCLNELESARARHEQQREDRLPEPFDIGAAGIGRLEALDGADRIERMDQISMAFLVLLERLSPAERAVLLLHEVFDFHHDEIAQLVSRSPSSCRKLLERARQKIADGRKLMTAPREEHQRLLEAFVRAATTGDAAALTELLAEDATLITDGGPAGRSAGGVRNLRRPMVGGARIAAFIAQTRRAVDTTFERRELNGQPALILFRGDEVFAVLQLAVSDGKVQQVFFQGDPARLRFVGQRRSSAPS